MPLKMLHRLVEIPGPDHRQHRAENLVLPQPGLGSRLGKDGGLEIVAPVPVHGLAAQHESGLGAALVDLGQDGAVLGLRDHRADREIFLRRSNPEFGGGSHHPLQQLIINLSQDDQPGGPRTFLARIAKGAGDDGGHGLVQVGGFIHHHGVFAAHFQKGPLQPDLARMDLRRPIGDAETHVLGAGEIDEAAADVVHQVIAHLAAAAGKKVDDAIREAGGSHQLHESGGDHGSIRRRLQHHGVAGGHRADGHAHQDGQGKIPGGDDHPGPQGLEPRLVDFSRIGHDRQGAGQLQGLAGVILAEVDGLADVGFGLQPVLGGLQGFPGGEFVFVAAQLGGELQDGGHPRLGAELRPGRKGPPGGVQGLVRLRRSGRGHRAHHFGGPGRVEADDFLFRINRPAADAQRPMAAQTPAHLGQGLPVGRGPGGIGQNR